MAEAPSKETSTSGVKPKPTNAGSEGAEDSEIPLHPRSCRIRGPVVVTVEELLEEIIERQKTGDELMPSPVPTRIAPSSSL